jgi:imidazolonepropionase-like amidohydrolase
MVEAGMLSVEAIKAATISAAELLGEADQLGSLEKIKLLISLPWMAIR